MEDRRPAGIAWRWNRFWYGVVLALPGAALITVDPQLGLGLAVGMLPAAAAGLPPVRRRRWLSAAVSAVAAVSLVVGAALGLSAITAVLGLLGLGIGASLAAARLRGGRLAMLLAFPLIGIGLSFDLAGALSGGAVIVLGGLYAWLVSLLWPERPAFVVPRDPQAPTPLHGALHYGILLGLTGATAAAVAFGFDVDHKGWVCGAALLVMRPATGQLVTRSLGRAASVLIGAVLGSALIALTGSPWAIAGAVLLTIAAMAATTGSRWYVTPAFTTVIVFLLLLWDHPGDSAWRFVQRNLETLAGVGIAVFYGVLIPLVIRRLPGSSGRGTPAPAR